MRVQCQHNAGGKLCRTGEEEEEETENFDGEEFFGRGGFMIVSDEKERGWIG